MKIALIGAGNRDRAGLDRHPLRQEEKDMKRNIARLALAMGSAIAAGAFAKRGICGTSSGFTYPRSNIIFNVCSVSFSRSGDNAMLCVYAPTAQLK